MRQMNMRRTSLIMLVLLLVGLVASAQAATDTEMKGRLQVSGVGAVEVAPDQATVILRLSQLRDVASEAQQANAAALHAVEQYLFELGLTEKDLRTQSVSLREEWEYVNSERQFRGFRAEQVLAVTVSDLGIVGRIMDQVVKVDGVRIDGVQFGLKDRRTAEKLALQEAYAHAFSRAQVLAEMAGISLDVPTSIIDQSSVVAPLPIQLEQSVARSALAYDAATPVYSGTIRVEARVHLEFTY